MLRLVKGTMFLLCSLLAVGAAQAKLPFMEDFSKPLDTSVWKISDGNWEVKDGALVASNASRGSGPNDPLTGFPFGTFDYVVALNVGTNMDVQVDATPTALGVQLDADGNLTSGEFTRIGLMVHSNGAAQFADKKWMLLWGWMNTPKYGLALLEEAVAWRQENPDIQLVLGKTYTFKVEVQGKHVKGKVWEKGTTEPDWQTEDDFAGQLTDNGIGLLGVGADVKYDNLIATPLTGVPGTLTGTVKDAAGKALAGVSVTNGDTTVTTDASGKYTISVVAGTVGLVASKSGYITTPTTDPVDVEAGGTVSGVDITLKPEQVPLTDDFGANHKEWLFPDTGDFNGLWTYDNETFVASNKDGVADAPEGSLPAQGLYDYAYLPDVASDVVYTAEVTPKELGTSGFSRIGLATHIRGGTGVGGGAEKKWMLLYGVLDVDPAKPIGLALLEEGVHWGPLRKDIQLVNGKTYIFKMATHGTDVRGKVWEKGTTEPTDWQVQDTFSLNQIYAAGIGLLGVGANVSYDNVNVVSNATTLGDLNGDGKVNIADATMALQFAVGNGTPTAAQLAAGDVVGGDGKIGIPDVTKILQAAIGAITL